MSDLSHRGTSVAGPPAEAALDALIGQFSERSAFVRELVQNSLDAGSGRIEVVVRQQGPELVIEVVDDGEGMNREIIEGYLLTLFRSSKEDDLTRIGKFGVGFVSLFAVRPQLVVLDTARDGLHWRVVFDADHTYTLVEVDEPFEGTAVRLHVGLSGPEAAALAEEVHHAVHYWCRYAHTEVWTEGFGSEHFGWGPEQVHDPFTTGLPGEVLIEEPGLRAVLAYARSDPPVVGYYNRGLTLLERPEQAVPGVSFRVEAADLEHTVTRDNVRRDDGFRRVVRRLRRAASESLPSAFFGALQQSLGTEPDQHQALLQIAAANPVVRIPRDLPVLATVDGRALAVRDLRAGPLGVRSRGCFLADAPDRLTEAIREAGHLVFRTHGAEVAVLQRLGIDARPAHEAWELPEVVPHALVDAIAEASWGLPCVGARFVGAAVGRLAIYQSRPSALERWRGPPRRGTLVIDTEHAVCRSLADRRQDLAAPLLLLAVRRSLGVRTEPSAEWLRALETALESA